MSQIFQVSGISSSPSLSPESQIFHILVPVPVPDFIMSFGPRSRFLGPGPWDPEDPGPGSDPWLG